MFKEQMNKIKSLYLKKTEGKGEEKEERLKEGGKTNKRKIENMAVFLIILIVTLIAINAILKRRWWKWNWKR